ncbi:MAG: bifunctional pyr operon transcriptional regulator/uracil phosphoribosyltransferase PyrR [Flavobacteriales bacterium]|nr:bifunctional pyr operon transcriptional regulator/uracil phosphoribosyltransferase PyrR [Flavobacteriales bacterium]
MKPKVLIDSELFGLILQRLGYQLIENHDDFSNCVILGLQPRGVLLMEAIVKKLKEISPNSKLLSGKIDPTFYRDDFRRNDKQLLASPTEIPFTLENKNVVLVDDVLYTGRTIRAGLEAVLEHGRPQKVELLVLIDRRFSRELPIEPMYIGKSVDSYDDQKVLVSWKNDGVPDSVQLLTGIS